MWARAVVAETYSLPGRIVDAQIGMLGRPTTLGPIRIEPYNPPNALMFDENTTTRNNTRDYTRTRVDFMEAGPATPQCWPASPRCETLDHTLHLPEILETWPNASHPGLD